MNILEYLKEEKKLNEIIGVIVCFIGILIFLSIISFNSLDYIAGANLSEALGGFGAKVLAYPVFYIFGKSSYLIPFILLVWGVFEIREKKIKEHLIVKVIAIIFIIVSFCAIFELTIMKGTERVPRQLIAGGVIGDLFVGLHDYIGVGLYLLIAALLLISIVLLTRLSFNQLFSILWRNIELAVKKIIEFFKFLGLKIWTILLTLLKKNSEGVKKNVQPEIKSGAKPIIKNGNIQNPNPAQAAVPEKNIIKKPESLKDRLKNIVGAKLPVSVPINSAETQKIENEIQNNNVTENQNKPEHLQPPKKSVIQIMEDEKEEREKMFRQNRQTNNVETAVPPPEEKIEAAAKIDLANDDYTNTDFQQDEIIKPANNINDIEEEEAEAETELFEDDHEDNPFKEQIKKTKNTNEIEVDEALEKTTTTITIQTLPPIELPPIAESRKRECVYSSGKRNSRGC